MKRHFLVLGIFTLVLLWGGVNMAALAQEKSGKKKRVAVFVFDDKTEHAWHWWNGQPVGDGMSEMLTTTLVKSGRYIVIERAQMDKILQEQGLAMSGAVNPQTAAQAGKILGVELAIMGAVTEFGYKKVSTGGALKKIGIGGALGKRSATVAVDVRFVNTSTAEILMAESVRKEKSKADISIDTDAMRFDSEAQFDETLVGKATREAINDIVKMLDEQSGGGAWEAKVMMVTGSDVIINSGKEGGVKIGDVFNVVRVGEELLDPDTGESLGATEEEVGIIEVTDNNYGGKGKASKCKIVSGSGFDKGNLVREKK